jgi:hypothetical protein
LICNIIIRSYPKLQHLSFKFCKITDKTIKKIACLYLNLKYFDLKGCKNISKKTIDQLISFNPNIYIENFIGTIITSDLIEAISELFS